MNIESEVIDEIEIESEDSEDESRPGGQEHASTTEEVSEDVLGDTQLGQDLGQLITEIRRDEENFQRSGESAEGGLETDPFDPSHFSLDTSFDANTGQPVETAPMEGEESAESTDQAKASVAADSELAESDDAPLAVALGAEASAEGDDAAPKIAQLVSEIESALQRFTQAERLRADQLIAEKEAQVAEQYRKLRILADKVAKQKAQIQEAKKELKAKLELADRLHIEFDGIRQVLNGKLGVLEQLEKEDEAAE